VLAVLGKPDHRNEDIDLTYGLDTFELTPPGLDFAAPERKYFLVFVHIKDPRAETTEGVGVGDSLSLVESRLTGPDVYPIFCGHNSNYDPSCTVHFDAYGMKSLTFIGDPIERITMG
jgi:hypothetical protein